MERTGWVTHWDLTSLEWGSWPGRRSRAGRAACLLGGASPQIVRKMFDGYRRYSALMSGIGPSQRPLLRLSNDSHRSGSTSSSTTTCNSGMARPGGCEPHPAVGRESQTEARAATTLSMAARVFGGIRIQHDGATEHRPDVRWCDSRPRTGRPDGLRSGSAVVGWGTTGGKMASSRPGLTPLRRGVGAALVVLLLVGAVLYYRTPSSAPTARPATSARVQSFLGCRHRSAPRRHAGGERPQRLTLRRGRASSRSTAAPPPGPSRSRRSGSTAPTTAAPRPTWWSRCARAPRGGLPVRARRPTTWAGSSPTSSSPKRARTGSGCWTRRPGDLRPVRAGDRRLTAIRSAGGRRAPTRVGRRR